MSAVEWPDSPILMRKGKALFVDGKFVLDSQKRCCPCQHCFVDQADVSVTVSGTGCDSECNRAAGRYTFYGREMGSAGCSWEWRWHNPDGLPDPDFHLKLWLHVEIYNRHYDQYKASLRQQGGEVYFYDRYIGGGFPVPGRSIPVCNGDNCDGLFSGGFLLPGAGGSFPCGENCIATVAF